MTDIDVTAARNLTLDADYGATHGTHAPASHTLHLFAGDPKAGGVELDTAVGSYAAPTLTNDATGWPTAAADQSKTAAEVAFATSTAAWSDEATHWALKGADGNWWDSDQLPEVVSVTTAGVVVNVTPTVSYATSL